MDAPTCPNCSKRFTLTDHQPRIFICGDIFCTPCCTDLINKSPVKCPICKEETKQIKDINELEIDNTILQGLNLPEQTQVKTNCDQLAMATKDAIACKICFEGFSLSDRRPRSFSCGHSFCTPCCAKLISQSAIKCPQCREIHDKNVKEVHEIPIAFQIEEILEAFGAQFCDEPLDETTETFPTSERNKQLLSSADALHSQPAKACSNSVSSVDGDDKIDLMKKSNKVVIPDDATRHQKLCKMDVEGPTITFRFGVGDVIGKGVLQLPFRWLTLNNYLRCSWVRVNFCGEEMKKVLMEDFNRHREMSLDRCKKLLDHYEINYNYDSSIDAWGCIKHDFYVKV